MTNVMANHQSYAGTIALMKNSRLVFRQGYGWRDANLTTTIHPDNLFRLASVSKPIAGSAIHKLVNSGKLSFSTPVYSYLGIQPMGGVLGDNRITNITVQHLLDHAGGWTGGGSGSECVFGTIPVSVDLGLNYPASASDVIRWKFSKPLDFTPGTTNVYSNFGYQVLGRVVEKASGKSFTEFIQQDLLGLKNVTNSIGFTNIVQSRTRARDLAPWEIWNVSPGLSFPETLPSAVDYPTNLLAHWNNGAYYFESFDSFGGLSASAIGLCKYMLTSWVGGDERVPGSPYGWGYTFYGGLPGASSAIYQNLSQNASTTNGLEFVVLFNSGEPVNERGINGDALDGILNVVTNITSWPTNGGGEIQWAVSVTNVLENAGSVLVQLVRSGLNTLPVRISYTTYATTASTSNFVPVSGVATFGSGETNKVITVQILNTGNADPEKQLLLELISASGGAWLGNNLTCVIAIHGTNTPPSIAVQPLPQTVLIGATAVLSASASGTPPLLYQWRKDGALLSGATNSTLLMSTVQTSDAGNFSVVVSNTLNSVTSQSATLTITNPPISPNCVPAPTGLLSWWNADNAANDRVGLNHGALMSMASYTPGYVGQAFRFDGVYDYVSVPHSSSLTFTSGMPLTLETWVYRTGTNLPFHVMGKRDTTSDYFYQLGYDGSDAPVPLNVWTHLLDTYDGTVYRRYMNGVLVKSTAQSPTSNPPNTAELRIAASGPYARFGGLIDDVRIYNRALAASEIQAIYAAGTNGMAPPARPALIAQPQSATVPAGVTLAFGGQASGSTPLSYQWLLNGVSIPGATNSLLIFTNVQVFESGNYSLRVANSLGSLTSSNAVLTVQAPPSLYTQPQSQTVNAGGSVTFTAAADGSPAPAYQWRFNGGNIANATNSSLTLTNVQAGQAGSYSVRVTNVVGTVTSASAVLTVNLPPTITTQPLGANVNSGASVTFTVAASGLSPFTYQWRRNGTNLLNATNATFTVASAQSTNAGNYSVVVSNALGSDTSVNAPLVINGPPLILLHPQSATANLNGFVLLSVTASSPLPIGYQWRFNGVNLNGAVSSSLLTVLYETNLAGNYTVVLTNAAGSVTSAVAVVAIATPPVITNQPQAVAVAVGGSATFTVAASGTAPFTYQWQFNGTNLVGATNASFTLAAAQTNDAGLYRVAVTNMAGGTVSSNAALMVVTPPVVTLHPQDVTVFHGSNTTFQAGASGLLLFYQWQKDSLGMTGRTNATLTLTNVARTNGGPYALVVTNLAGSVTSANATLNVHVRQRMDPPAAMAGGTFRLRFAYEDSVGLGTNDLPRFEVQTTTNFQDWVTLTNGLSLTNGQMQLDDPAAPQLFRRFYRIIER